MYMAFRVQQHVVRLYVSVDNALGVYIAQSTSSSAIQNRKASSVNDFLEIWKRKSPPFMRSTTMYLPRE